MPVTRAELRAENEKLASEIKKLKSDVQHNYEVSQQAMKDRESAIVERNSALLQKDEWKNQYDLAQKVLGDEIATLKKDLETKGLLIRDYQRALRKVDECCGCLEYDAIFKVLGRGTPDPKCEECNREQYRCDCLDKKKETEKKSCCMPHTPGMSCCCGCHSQ